MLSRQEITARYREKNREIINAKDREYYKKNSESILLSGRQQHIENPHKRKARGTLANAIRAGEVVRQLCFMCGKTAEAHHPCYDLPFAVSWLCTKHHGEVHKKVMI